MKVNGFQAMHPMAQQQAKKPPVGQGSETAQANRLSRDTYTPSVSAMSLTQASEVPSVSIENSFSTTEDYNYYLLSKYEGMTEYNITVSDELLEKARTNTEIAEKLESYIQSTIDAHENYDGDWIRVHTETEIEDISSSGVVKQSSLHVFASDQASADLFAEKNEMDSFVNSIERLLVDNATGATELDDSVAETLEKVASLFDEVFNGENASTGYANFLNKVLLNAEHITDEVINDNKTMMDAVSDLKDELTTLLEGNDLSEEVRSVLEKALGKCEEIIGGDSPLYDVITKEITVTYSGDFDKDAFDASRPESSLSAFGEEGSAEALESFREYMLKSNANLLQLMTKDTDTEESVVSNFYQELLDKIDAARLEAEEKLEAEEELEDEEEEIPEGEAEED